MMAGFLFGLFFEILFMIMFHFPSKPDGTPIAKGERMQFIKLPSLPDFAPASAALPAGVEEIVCTVRRMIVDPATAVAIVIGRHDQTELTPSAKRFLNSNAALAQQRAKAVESTFRDFRHCDTSPILNVIALDSTPRHVGPNVSPVQLADDRRAEIYLFRRVP